jgi:hypothetical protein
MTWPTTKAGTTNVDQGTDKISLARADIKQNIDNVNGIMDTYDTGGPYATQGNYSKQQYFGLQTLSYDSAGFLDWDVSTAQVAKIALVGSSTTMTITNAVAGATYILIIEAGVNEQLTIDGADYPSGVTPEFADNSKNVYTIIYDGTKFLVSYVLDLR